MTAVRYVSLTGCAALLSLPFELGLLPPHPITNAPPYPYLPRLQQCARYLDRQELWMSDIPWAVAWYGDRSCVWMPLNWRGEFFEVNDWHKTVNGLYVSSRTTDARFISNWFAGENQAWGALLLQIFTRREIPKTFPLKYAPEGLFTHGELLLMDRDRWSAPGEGQKN